MRASSYIESVKHLPVAVANERLEKACGIQGFFECQDDVQNFLKFSEIAAPAKEEFGDWQTPMDLALAVCRLLKAEGVDPKVIVEPTCGQGNFILAALQVFEHVEEVFGIEVQKSYLEETKLQLLQFYQDHVDQVRPRIRLYSQNVFDFDFTAIKKSINHREILVLGNPPWVTNSKLAEIGSGNIPPKRNFKKFGGLEAITGKSNFDIAEYISRQMVGLIADEKGHLALLLKNSVIRNLVYGQYDGNMEISSFRQYTIDAKKEFGVCVAASLLHLTVGERKARLCQVRDFYTRRNVLKYGWLNNHFVADVAAYEKCKFIDGQSSLVWRSGLKHDCAKVMELTFNGSHYVNGLNEVVNIERDMIYPLLKSSDIKGRNITTVRKYVIVTQRSTADDTAWIKYKYPRTYQYLLDHAEYLDKRGSRIYRGRSRFCLFGIGEYSFKPYKVVVSGLYKQPNFSVVGPIAERIVMLDDTCYMLAFDRLSEALIIQRALMSSPVQTFIRSLLFPDAKRAINKELLMRIDLEKALACMPDVARTEAERQPYETVRTTRIGLEV